MNEKLSPLQELERIEREHEKQKSIYCFIKAALFTGITILMLLKEVLL